MCNFCCLQDYNSATVFSLYSKLLISVLCWLAWKVAWLIYFFKVFLRMVMLRWRRWKWSVYFCFSSYCALHARKIARSRLQDGRRKSRQDDPALNLLTELESHLGTSNRQTSGRAVDTYAIGKIVP